MRLERRGRGTWAAMFQAMASPCEVLLAADDAPLALRLGELAAAEALRIERKYSRYRGDSVLAAIHARRGQWIALDDETASLLAFARSCHALSHGLFDVTSGVLREAWRFDGSDRVPSREQVQALLPRIGFGRLRWEPPRLWLPEGMELDFGGLGKEYAVDCACTQLAAERPPPVLVNFGGDLRALGNPPDGPWQVGVERPGTEREAALRLDLSSGALATSGDARRYLLKDGIRYGHVLDPRTGWPVPGAPRSITVAGASCVEAGLLATLALLHGAGAEEFLAEQGARHWALR